VKPMPATPEQSAATQVAPAAKAPVMDAMAAPPANAPIAAAPIAPHPPAATPSHGKVATVAVRARTTQLHADETPALTVAALTARSDRVKDPAITGRAEPPELADIESSGPLTATLTPRASGAVRVVATCDGVEGALEITIAASAITAVALSPETLAMTEGE